MTTDGYEFNKPVLDHGYVKYIDHMGGDSDIIEAARMSTGKGFLGWDDHERCSQCDTARAIGVCHSDVGHPCPAGITTGCKWKVTKGDKNLLEFLYRNRHSSPFESCELAIEVQAPIMVFREWHRHRTQSYNEFSARYAQMPNLHYVPDVSRFTPNDSKNKQAASIAASNALGLDGTPEEIAQLHLDQQRAIADEQNATYAEYESLIADGVPKEIARVNTPVSRYSKMRAKTDLRNWLGFLNLRLRSNAQYEIRVYAQAVAEIIGDLFPRTYALFLEHDLHSVTFSRSEMQTLRDNVRFPQDVIPDGTLREKFVTAGVKP
jgi:thymidylate synthase (FAD)